jgi:hypothetical protein
MNIEQLLTEETKGTYVSSKDLKGYEVAKMPTAFINNALNYLIDVYVSQYFLAIEYLLYDSDRGKSPISRPFTIAAYRFNQSPSSSSYDVSSTDFVGSLSINEKHDSRKSFPITDVMLSNDRGVILQSYLKIQRDLAAINLYSRDDLLYGVIYGNHISFGLLAILLNLNVSGVTPYSTIQQVKSMYFDEELKRSVEFANSQSFVIDNFYHSYPPKWISLIAKCGFELAQVADAASQKLFSTKRIKMNKHLKTSLTTSTRVGEPSYASIQRAIFDTRVQLATRSSSSTVQIVYHNLTQMVYALLREKLKRNIWILNNFNTKENLLVLGHELI